MGSKKKQTIGFWYRPIIKFGLCQGPIDAFLQFRGGDRPAWEGELTASGEIYVNAPELWGGTDSEGGLQGLVDIRLGGQAQTPSTYLLDQMGGPQSAFRGKATVDWKGGRYGAMNPYPKPASFKIRRILKGWDGDVCWYPEKAEIGQTEGGIPGTGYAGTSGAEPLKQSADLSTWLTGTESGIGAGAIDLVRCMAGRVFVLRTAAGRVALRGSEDWQTITGLATGSGSGPQFMLELEDALIVGYNGKNFISRSEDGGESFANVGYDAAAYTLYAAAASGDQVLLSATVATVFYSADKGLTYAPYAVPFPALTDVTSAAAIGAVFYLSSTANQDIFFGHPLTGWTALPHPLALGSSRLVLHVREGLLCVAAGAQFAKYNPATSVWTAPVSISATRVASSTFIADSGAAMAIPLNIGLAVSVNDGDTWVAAVSLASALSPRVDAFRDYFPVAAGLKGMNPAHILYDALASQNMQGEPTALINVTSFTAAANTLYAEGFGLCTKYDPDGETVDEFRQRICAVIGASCSRSRSNGQWYLDLIRGDYDISALPVLGDDDILEYQEDPTTLDDAVNQVIVEWFDPQLKEDRSTAPLHALGAIQATGGIISETIDYPEIPVEPLALRAGARELRNKATPLRRMRLVCNRTPYAWRIGTYFRLQAPKRGIADMVCLVGEIDTGTLRSGAIALVAVQDVFGMPETTYVVAQPPPPAVETPIASPFQRLIEAPYVELVATLARAELAAMPADAGYVIAMGTQPSAGHNYRLLTAAASEEYEAYGTGEWCPTATLVAPAALLDTTFTLGSRTGLSNVAVGTAALWENEIVRVDALDDTLGTLVLGRGCADTVPAVHAAGTRLFFYDAFGASDQREYAGGETVRAKLLTRTAAALLPEVAAAAISVVTDDRAVRPYPPGQARINTLVQPTFLFGVLTAAWVHRDRVLQADQLVDSEMAGIGPEPTATVTVRWYLDNVLVHTHTGLTGTSQAYTPAGDGLVRVEIESVRDGFASWQAHVREFDYTVTEAELLLAESGSAVQAESGSPFLLE